MDFLAGYGDADGADTVNKPKLDSAPAVEAPKASSSALALTAENSQASLMFAPVTGPSKPYSAKSIQDSFVEEVFLDVGVHSDQHELYESRGYAQSLGGKGVLGNVHAALVDRAAQGGVHVDGSQKKRKKRESKGDAASESFRGPWAPYESAAKRTLLHAAAQQPQQQPPPEEEPQTPAAAAVADEEEGAPAVPTVAISGPYSRLFIKYDGPDYLGRTYMSVPTGLKHAVSQNYIPKKKWHQFKGHAKAVTRTRFFPDTGHLLLTSSLDSRIMLWETTGNKRKLRVSQGHTKGVKDVKWRHKGAGFISAAVDGNVFVWDSETGQHVTTLNNGNLPYCLDVHESHPNSVLVGTRSNVIYQWDTRSAQVVQEYDRHLGPVNAVAFIDQGRRFISTSDDKSIRYWEFGIGVEIKIHSEPYMHSAPVVALRGNDWAAVQSMDNQILLYGVGDSYKTHHKRFHGHMNAGYACGLTFSRDGSILCSGDAGGKLFFWDYKTSRLNAKLNGHKGAVLAVDWHPREASKVASGGWDGKVLLWN